MILSMNLIERWDAHCSDPELCFLLRLSFLLGTNSVFHSFKVKTNRVITDVQSRLFLVWYYLSIYLSIYSQRLIDVFLSLSLSLLLNLVPSGIYQARRMPSYTMLNIKMQRDSNSTPWGFRMQGRVDLFDRMKRLNACEPRWKRFRLSTANSESQSG